MTAPKNAQIVWQGGLAFEGTAGSGFKVRTDTTADENGGNGFSPMELVLIGLASCTAMDVISILQKKQQDVKSFEVFAHGDRAEDHPKVYTDILLEFVVKGKAVNEQAVCRSIELSAEKYCSVMGMLKKVVKIRTRYLVEEA